MHQQVRWPKPPKMGRLDCNSGSETLPHPSVPSTPVVPRSTAAGARRLHAFTCKQHRTHNQSSHPASCCWSETPPRLVSPAHVDEEWPRRGGTPPRRERIIAHTSVAQTGNQPRERDASTRVWEATHTEIPPSEPVAGARRIHACRNTKLIAVTQAPRFRART